MPKRSAPMYSSSSASSFVEDNPLPHQIGKHRYSLMRAIASATEGNGFPDGLEGEVSKELALREGRKARGFLVPWDARTLNTTSGVGGIPTLLPENSFFDILRSKLVCAGLGARFVSLGGAYGSPVSIPRVTQKTTVQWVADGGSPGSQANLMTAPVLFSPRSLAAWTDLTRKAWKSFTPAYEAFVFQDIAASIAVEIDRAALNGSGVSNEPTGLLSLDDIPVLEMGTNGALPTRATFLSLEEQLGLANGDADAEASLGVATTIKARKYLRSVDLGGGRFLWADDNYVVSSPAVATNNLPANLTKGSGTNLSSLIYGAWDGLVINTFGSIDLRVNPYMWAMEGALRLTAHQEIDVNVTNVDKFVIVKDIVTSA